MSNYQSLRKAGFSDKQLRKMGITPQFPDNPKFNDADFVTWTKMTDLKLIGISNINYKCIIGCAVGHYGIPLDIPLTVHTIGDGLMTHAGRAATSYHTPPSALDAMLAQQEPNCPSHEFYKEKRHYIGIVDDGHFADTLNSLAHELAHFVDHVKGRAFHDPATGEYVFDGVRYKTIHSSEGAFGEYENQPHEKSANVNGTKIVRAYFKAIGIKNNFSDFFADMLEFYLDPMNCPDRIRKNLVGPATSTQKKGDSK